jgi:hypothetical protein
MSEFSFLLMPPEVFIRMIKKFNYPLKNSMEIIILHFFQLEKDNEAPNASLEESLIVDISGSVDFVFDQTQESVDFLC